MSAPASYINPTVNVKQQPNQAYVALQAFNTQLSNYTTGLNQQFQTVGTFSAVPNATAANCPAGRVVYATGKVLVPGANPSVTTPLVKVLDPDSGLNGFVTLDPAYFAPYSQVLSVQNTTSDVNGTLVLTNNLGGAGSNASVGGSLTVDNGLTVTAGGATVTAGGLTVTAGGATVTAGGLTVTAGGISSLDPAIPIGYGAGSGGNVIQGTNKSTAVTLNKVNGTITMDAASLAGGASVQFTLNNTTIGANDLLILNHTSVSLGNYTAVVIYCTTSSAVIRVTNTTGGALLEAIVLTFAVIKASAA